MDRTPGGFGGKLREARERRGITLSQIASATKISTSALDALERNDISRLPGGIFSRAFVRSYAIEVGLDPEETIREFIAQFPHDSVTAGHSHAQQTEDNETVESDRRMASAFLRLVALSVPVAAVVLYFSLAGRQASLAPGPPEHLPQAGQEAPPVATTPVEDLAEPAPPEPVDVAQAGVTSDLADDRLAVGLLATAPCWVSATVDGQKVIAREMQRGERQQFAVQRELILSAGDAGALAITFNGVETKPFGRSGEVVTRRFDLANFREFLIVP